MGGFGESKDMHRHMKVLLGACLAGAAHLASAADIIIDGQSIIGSDIESISINPTSGDVIIQTFPGYTVTKDTEPPPDSVVIDTFITSKSSMEINQTANLSWTTSNAVSCTTSNGTSGWRAHTPAIPNGNKNVTIPTAAVWTFTLTCNGAAPGDTAVRNVAITVTDPGEPPPPPPPDTCDTPPLSGSTVTWASFWLESFPEPVYDIRNIDIPRFGYKAISFNTGNVVDNGSLGTIESTLTSGARFGALSSCPGDFDVADDCRHVWGLGGGIKWATDGTAGACQLDANTNYYFNITFTDGFDSSLSECQSAPCRTKVQHANF